MVLLQSNRIFFPLTSFSDLPALIDADDGQIVTYSQLADFSQKIQTVTPKEKTLIFLFNGNKIQDVFAYIGAINEGHTVCLLDKGMKEPFKKHLIELYCPDFIFNSDTKWENYRQIDSPWESVSIYQIKSLPKRALHPHLQLLLTTSGTTGNPKLIRLSKENLLSNALSIIDYLHITPLERAIASLPFHYSYGLSVLHSHLLSGASIVLTQSSPVQAAFWDLIHSHACTSMAGVPYTYKAIDRIGFETFDLPNLRTLTQAGGRLENALILKYHALMQKKGGRFFVMYGQTEATARIAYLPSHLLPNKVGGIGIAIPGGRLRLFQDKKEILSPRQIGQLYYEGANIMLGYASSPSDLEKGDEMNGILPTGDLAYFDEDAIFFLEGRLKRISKVYGLRINLDDLENELSPYGIIAVTTTETHICLHIECGTPQIYQICVDHLSRLYQLHPSTFLFYPFELLPKTSTGKIDYQQLQKEC